MSILKENVIKVAVSNKTGSKYQKYVYMLYCLNIKVMFTYFLAIKSCQYLGKKSIELFSQ